jgi:hypothetical protein
LGSIAVNVGEIALRKAVFRWASFLPREEWFGLSCGSGLNLNLKRKTKTMNKTLGLVLLGVGIALIVFGVSASDSIGSEVSRAVTGTPTDKALWLLIGGIGATIAGAFVTFRRA